MESFDMEKVEMLLLIVGWIVAITPTDKDDKVLDRIKNVLRKIPLLNLLRRK